MPDMAWRIQELGYKRIDPLRYKDLFKNPDQFEEAWNHECPFQRKKWREAINKEFSNMDLNVLWRKVKHSSIPKGH